MTRKELLKILYSYIYPDSMGNGFYYKEEDGTIKIFGRLEVQEAFRDLLVDVQQKERIQQHA